jgi:hypothetical protein
VSVPFQQPNSGVGSAACFLSIGVGVTAVPLLGFLVGPVLGVALAAGAALVATRAARPALPALVVFAFVFQNLIVSVLIPHLESVETFKSIRAMNFVFTASCFLWLVLFPSPNSDGGLANLGRVKQLIMVALALIAVYFVLGAAGNLKGAVIYLRNVVSPLLMAIVALLAAASDPRAAWRYLHVVAVIAVAYGYVELLVREPLMGIVNGEDYIALNSVDLRESGYWLKRLNETGYVVRRYSEIQQVDLFNSPLFADLGIQIFRLLGPNFHSISYAYVVMIAALLFYASGRWGAFLGTMPLMVTIGSKGAIVCLGMSLVGHWLQALPHRLAVGTVAGLLAVYVAAGLAIGLMQGDYHVLGFMAGIRSFLANPVGAGLGAGGNLSGDMTVIDWGRAQALGHADYPVESAVGVLLHQMGGAAILVLAAYVAIGLLAWRRLADRPTQVFAVAAITTTVNGIFQEEALFAPLALGGILVCLAVALREAPARAPAAADHSFARRTLTT